MKGGGEPEKNAEKKQKEASDPEPSRLTSDDKKAVGRGEHVCERAGLNPSIQLKAPKHPSEGSHPKPAREALEKTSPPAPLEEEAGTAANQDPVSPAPRRGTWTGQRTAVGMLSYDTHTDVCV